MATARKKKKNTTWIYLAVIGAILAIVAVVLLTDKEDVMVEVEPVTKRTILAFVSESGVIQPKTEVKIAPDVSGEIVDLRFKEGDEVKKGDLLVTIQPENYKSALEQANASLNASKANYMQAKAALGQAKAKYLQDSANFARTNQLYKEKVVSKLEWENSELQKEISKSQYNSSKQSVQASYFTMKNAEATLKQARQNLDRTNIYASMDGIVTQVNVEIGERVVGTMQMAGTEIMRVADLSRMEVKVEINENDIINIRIGDTARVEVDAYEGKTFKGTVSEIAYSAIQSGLGTTDQITNFEVKVEINPGSYLQDPAIMRGLTEKQSPFRPGMSAQVDIFTDKETDVVAVPLKAVTIERNDAEGEGYDPDKANEIVYIYSPEKGTVALTIIQTGISDDEYIKIEAGLEGGEIIVTGPYLTLTKTLKDGLEVSELDLEKKYERRRKNRGKKEE